MARCLMAPCGTVPILFHWVRMEGREASVLSNFLIGLGLCLLLFLTIPVALPVLLDP